MQITQNTDDTFVINVKETGGAFIWAVFFFGFLGLALFAPRLSDTPPPAGVYLVLLFFAAFFGLLTVLSARRSQIVLTRSKGGAVLRRRTLFGHRNHRFDLSDINCFYPSQKFDIQSAVPDSRQAYLNIAVTKGMDAGDYSVSTYLRPMAKVAPVCEVADAWLTRADP